MATTTDLEKLVINYLTQDQYDDAREAGTLNANELYLTPDTGSTGGTVTSVAVTNGGALSVSGSPITTSGTITISHADTSSQSSVSNSGRTYIQSVTLDTYGHVTGLSSATETVTNTDEKLGTDAVTSGTTYYIIAGTNTTGAERKKYDASGIAYKATNGTANGTNGEALLTLGNSTASTSANWKAGKIFLYSSSAYGGTLVSEAVTSSSKTWTLPNKTGTIALTSDIPDVSGFITTDSDEKLKTVALTSGTTYYPILANGANAAANRQVDSTLAGLKYVSSAGTTSAVGTATLYLGNSTASGSANNEQGVLRMYATNTRYVDIKTESTYAPTGARNRYLPSYDADMYLVGTSTTNAVGGATTAPVYVDDTGRIQAVTSIPYSLLTGTPTIPTDTNTTYTLTNALSSHKFTWTFTAGGSGSGSTTTFAEFAAGTGISLADDTSNSNKKITINHSNSVTAKSTQAVYPITFDAQGHITGSGTAVTIPTVPGIATNTTAGLVKPWYYWQQSSTGPTAGTVNSSATVNARSATAGRYYPIEMDKDGRMFVNVPWTNENSAYITTDTNTTYTLSGALSSHKFTSTLTPSSGTETSSDFTLVAGTGITITDTTNTRTMTIACSVTNTDTKVTQAYSTASNSYPLLMTATSGITSTSSRGDTTSILNNQIYANPSTGTITATAFSGTAAATTAYTTANLKNIVESTSDPGTASSYPTGTVWIKYTA